MDSPRNSHGAARWLPIVAPALSGCLIAAPWLDFSLYLLGWIAFVPLLWSVLTATSRRQAIRIGLIAGIFTNVPAFYWLVYTMQVFGGFPLPIAVFFYACLSLYSALQFVFFAVAVQRNGVGPLAILPALAWTSLEFLFPNLFPWRMANPQYSLPILIQIGDLTGPFGLSLVMVWVQTAVVVASRPARRLAPLVASFAALAIVLTYGAWRMPQIQLAIDAAPVVRAGLVQGNVGIIEKRNVSYFDINLEKYESLSRPLEDDVDLLLWPETVSQVWIPTGTRVLPPHKNPYPDLRTFLVYGGLSFTETGPDDALQYNAAFLIGPDGILLGEYRKQILLPFGEYLPGASIFPFLKKISPQTGDFDAGTEMRPLEVPGKIRIAPLICYEDVPARIARAMTQAGAEALLTMFNDAWFGPTIAPYQHEAIALWRAVENRRYFARVGNAGVTGVIDPFGRVVGRLGLFTAESMTATLRPLHIETFYTRYGDVFGWSVVALTLVALIRCRRLAA